MARRGFEPHRREQSGEVELVLGRCPYRALAATDPDVVCEMHLGLAEGIVEAAGAEVEVTQLVARDPVHAGCSLMLRYTQPASEPADD